MSMARASTPRSQSRRRPHRLLLAALCLALLAATFAGGRGAAAQSIVIEMQQGAFEDARVRKAVILSTDWLRLAEQAGVQADTILLRDGRRESVIDVRRPDLDGARRLMAEAGYSERKPLQIYVLFEQPLEKLVSALVEPMYAIGLAPHSQAVLRESLDTFIKPLRYSTGRQTVEIPYLLMLLEKSTAAPPQRLADLAVIGRPVADFAADSRVLTVSVDIANLGSAAAGPHLLRIADRSGALEIPPVKVEGLGPRESRGFKTGLEVPASLLGREVVLFAVVDSEHEVPESDEGNNRSEPLVLALPAAPRLADLVVEGAPSVAYDPASRSLTVDVTVANLSSAIAGPSHVALEDRSGTLRFPDLALGPLAPGERRSLRSSQRIEESALGRTLVLFAEADPAAEVRESDEKNNRGQARRFTLPLPPAPPDFRPQRRPDAFDNRSIVANDLLPENRSAPTVYTDLSIAALHLSHQAEASLLRVRLTIANRGSFPSPATVVELHAETQGAMERLAVPELAPGALWQADWSIPLGSALFGQELSVAAFVDPDDVVAETVESNNRSQQVLAIATPPRTWMVGAGLAAGLLLLTVLMLRARPGRSGKATPPAAQLSYGLRPDPGAQDVVRRGEAPAVTFELALRPRCDRGTQSVISGSG